MFDRFEQLMKEHKLTFAKISRETGIPYSTFTDWKAGRYTPKLDKLQKIADYFGVSVEYLSGKTDSPDGVALYVQHGWYTNSETADIAQKMFDDPQMRSLFHMKENMDPEKFQAHYDMMKRMYLLEHPEDADDFSGS